MGDKSINMTEAQKNSFLTVGIISGIEIAFGVIEAMVLPNIFERKRGEPIFIPAKEGIAKIAGTLLITGFASGLISDWLIEKYEIAENDRWKTIAAVAIGINLIETFATYNLSDKTGKKNKYFPAMEEFIPAFAFLTLSSFTGGVVSSNIIAAINPAAPAAPATPAPSGTETASAAIIPGGQAI